MVQIYYKFILPINLSYKVTEFKNYNVTWTFRPLDANKYEILSSFIFHIQHIVHILHIIPCFLSQK